jgi:hypothetical protein
MATRALFISQAYLYETTEIDENTNWKVIRPTIWDCQEIYIQDIIGTPLYDALKAEIIANDGSLTTPRFVTLVDNYVAPCLLKYVIAETQVPMLFKFRNQSVLKGRTDNADSVEFDEHKYLKDYYTIRAEKYAKKIERYLIANSTTFPEYTTYTDSDEVRAQSQSATTSLYLPRLNNCNIDRG